MKCAKCFKKYKSNAKKVYLGQFICPHCKILSVK